MELQYLDASIVMIRVIVTNLMAQLISMAPTCEALQLNRDELGRELCKRLQGVADDAAG